MKRINLFTCQLVRETACLYNLDSVTIRSPQDIATTVQTVLNLEQSDVERFGIITLTTKNKIAGLHVLAIGSLSAAIVHPREVFKQAILNNAAAIICFHNHPSGDPAPSSEDIGLTKRLCDAGELIGIDVLDHVILGYRRFSSLKELGHM